jgi:hypothetical protein
MQFPAVGVKLGVVVQLCAVPLPEVSKQVTGIDPEAFSDPSALPPLMLTAVPSEPTPQVGQEIITVDPVVVATIGLLPLTAVTGAAPPSWSVPFVSA